MEMLDFSLTRHAQVSVLGGKGEISKIIFLSQAKMSNNMALQSFY